jgi:hypothetical protein
MSQAPQFVDWCFQQVARLDAGLPINNSPAGTYRQGDTAMAAQEQPPQLRQQPLPPPSSLRRGGGRLFLRARRSTDQRRLSPPSPPPPRQPLRTPRRMSEGSAWRDRHRDASMVDIDEDWTAKCDQGKRRRPEAVTFTVRMDTSDRRNDPEMAMNDGITFESPASEMQQQQEEEMAEQEQEHTEPDGAPATKQRKMRCQFWPNCRNPTCRFWHPVEPCKNFPRCQFGDECLFIHPACQYGIACTRPGCHFAHPQRGGGGGGHGGTMVGGRMLMPQILPMGLASVPAPPSSRSSVPCRNGYACPGRLNSCSFKHPPPACKFGTACRRMGCSFAHGTPCRNGSTCTTPGCTFVHEPPQQ